MSTIAAKQVNKILSAPIRVSNFTAAGADDGVTAAITSALSTAGNGGVSVPLQVSSSAAAVGVIVASPHNRVEVYANATGRKLTDSNGNEVYGRISEASGSYTIAYFVLAAGAESSYSFASTTAIDFEVNYRFDFDRYPTDGAIGIQSRNVSQDPAQLGGSPFAEQLTVTATNTLSALSKTPVSANVVELIVNGLSYDSIGGGAARFSVNLSTRAVTWSAANAGFSIETTDRVIARYFSNE